MERQGGATTGIDVQVQTKSYSDNNNKYKITRCLIVRVVYMGNYRG